MFSEGVVFCAAPGNPKRVLLAKSVNAIGRIHKEPAAHYESASTRQFRGGRTETIRSCSEASVSFAQAMLDESTDDATKATRLKAAIEEHKNYAKDVS